MVGAPAAGLDPVRPALPLAVRDDGEAYAAIDHVTVVDADVLLAGGRIERIRMVRHVGLVYRVDHPRRLDVAALGRGAAVASVHLLATFAPDVPLNHIMIVRQANGWPIAHHLT